jgi:DNA mismatch endonuclease, patch repair protein
MDNLSKEKRSKVMSAIRSKDTKPEIALREALKSKGLKFVTYYGSEKIDVAFPTEKLAVFIDGCFWHACPIHSHPIGTNEEYWRKKLEKNKERDILKTEKLETEGWIVLRFWEHELKDVDLITKRILKTLKTNALFLEINKKAYQR